MQCLLCDATTWTGLAHGINITTARITVAVVIVTYICTRPHTTCHWRRPVDLDTADIFWVLNDVMLFVC